MDVHGNRSKQIFSRSEVEKLFLSEVISASKLPTVNTVKTNVLMTYALIAGQSYLKQVVETG